MKAGRVVVFLMAIVAGWRRSIAPRPIAAASIRPDLVRAVRHGRGCNRRLRYPLRRRRHRPGPPRRRHDRADIKMKMKGPNMAETSLIRTALLVALITAFGLAATGRAPAAEASAAPIITLAGSQAAS
jgi:hypothetical protein